MKQTQRFDIRGRCYEHQMWICAQCRELEARGQVIDAKHAPPRVNTYAVLRRAIEEGIVYGWRRAHKYTDTPTEPAAHDAILNAVMGEVCEVFEFDEEGDEP